MDLHEFSAREVADAGQDGVVLLLHFSPMSADDFANLMADVIARAGEHFDVNTNDLFDYIGEHLPDAMTRTVERIN
jgi:hypothetical protein